MRNPVGLLPRLEPRLPGEDPGVAAWRIRRGRPAPWENERHAVPAAEPSQSRLLPAPEAQLLAPPPHPVAARVPAGERPYVDVTADQVTAYRIAFTSGQPVARPSNGQRPRTAPATAPMAAVQADTETPVLAARTDRDAAEQVLTALQGGIDWEALDAARSQENLSYARTTGAPFHNALVKERQRPLGDPLRPAWRPPAVPAKRHADAVLRRLGDVTYPAISGFTPRADYRYAELLRRVSVITGTTGIGNWRPAPSAGGAA